jgi:hypothetical protein
LPAGEILAPDGDFLLRDRFPGSRLPGAPILDGLGGNSSLSRHGLRHGTGHLGVASQRLMTCEFS